MYDIEQDRLHHKYKINDVVKIIVHQDEGLDPYEAFGIIEEMDEYSFDDLSPGYNKHIRALCMDGPGSFVYLFNDEDVVCKMERTDLTKEICLSGNIFVLRGYKDNEDKIYYLYTN